MKTLLLLITMGLISCSTNNKQRKQETPVSFEPITESIKLNEQKMSNLQKLINRNSQFATQYENNLTLMPRLSTVVLTCIDATDPSYFLGLEAGDAIVFRTAGARVSEQLELDLGVLWEMAKMASKSGGKQFRGFELVIIQHTDCGYERLANPKLQHALNNKLGIDKVEIEALANVDHAETILRDIERLQHSLLVPNELIVSGHIYHLEDGVVREVVASAPLSRNNN